MDSRRIARLAQDEVRQKAIKDFTSMFLNTFTDPDDLVDALVNEHRTLQQNFGRMVADFCTKVADRADEFGFDDRNEATVKMARLVRDEVLPQVGGFPLI